MQTTKNWRAIPSSPVPLYAQVREILRERILDGSYQAHAQLPAESELGAIFGISRITVRQALGDLQKEGIIFKIPGKGSYVAKPKAYQQLTHLEGFGEAMSRLGYDIHNRVVGHENVAASRHVAQQLGLEQGSQVAQIKRIRHLNRSPVSFEITYVPTALGERLRSEDLARRDIFLILENDYGIALGSAHLQIDAVAADATLAQLLQVAPGTALMRLERLTQTAAGAPLDFEYLYFRGDAFQYRMHIARRGNALNQPTGNEHADPYTNR